MNAKPKHSARADRVARWFGVDRHTAAAQAIHQKADPPTIALSAGQLILITGPSGAGKSTLLRRLRRRHRARCWIDLRQIALPRALVVDLMTEALGGGDSEQAIVAALRALSQVGLGEVWTYLRTPAQLSLGQRWRLRLALALANAKTSCGDRTKSAEESRPLTSTNCDPNELTQNASRIAQACPRPQLRDMRCSVLGGGRGHGTRGTRDINCAGGPEFTILTADEFAAPLDRITALVVSRALRKAITAQPNLSAIVATGRDDLLCALQPDLHIRCDFGTCDITPKGGLS